MTNLTKVEKKLRNLAFPKKPLELSEKNKILWREGYPKYRIEEIWDEDGLIGANYWDKKTGDFVRSKLAIKGKRTLW